MKVLLHICCAVCASSCVERLRQQDYEVSGYFYNPNVQPREEYLKRLQATKRLARQQNFPLIVGKYDADAWFSQIKGLEEEPEGGRRCIRCFTLRLKETAKLTKDKGFDTFTTTLTVSPHKNTQAINEIGQKVGNNLFLTCNFKQQNGFKRAQELARQYNLYHQDYCGCIYSLKERQNYGRIYQKTCPGRPESQTSSD